MRQEKDPEDDRTTRVGSAVPWRVVEVEALPDYILAVRFADGTRGKVDLSVLIKSEIAGVFESLRDPQLFAKVGVEAGAVSWPHGVDLAPDAMYDNIRASGRWTPT